MGTICPKNTPKSPKRGRGLSSEEGEWPPAAKTYRLYAGEVTTRMSSAIKTIVSKKKRRFIADGFNLDLSYIVNNRIIAMGFPAESVESLYRNSLEEVKRFLEAKHRDHYMIYNLCSERSYDYKKFAGRVRTYPFDDHHPPNFSTIRPFCEDVQAWLDEDDENVAVVHCKAGKGRTGTMICCYLLHQQGLGRSQNGGGGRVPESGESPTWETAEDVLEYYGQQRTQDKKGVTIPSQRRYINYYSSVIRNRLEYKPVKLYLTSVVLDPVPNFNFNQFYIQFKVEQSRPDLTYFSPDYPARGGVRQKEFKIWPPLLIVGDVKVEFSYKLNMDMVGLNPKHMKPNKAFHYWFNSFFVDSAFSSGLCHEVKRCHGSNSLSEESGGEAVTAAAAVAAGNNGNGTVSSGNGNPHRFILGGDPAPPSRPLSHTPGVRWSTDEPTAHFEAAEPANVITSVGGKRHVSSEGGVPSHGGKGAGLSSEDSADGELTNLLKETSISADMLSPSGGGVHHHNQHAPLSHAHSGSGGGGSGGGLSSASSSTSSSASTSLAALQQQSFTFNDHRKRHTSVPQTSAARLNHAHSGPHQHAPSAGGGHAHLASSGSSNSSCSEGGPKSLNQNSSSPANLGDKSELPRGTHVSLMLRKPQVDKASKDKKCGKYTDDFKVTMFLIKAEDQSDAADYVVAPSCPAVVTPGKAVSSSSHTVTDSSMSFKNLLAKSGGDRKAASRTLSGAHLFSSVTSTTSSSTASAKNSSESSDEEEDEEEDTTDSEATQRGGTQSHVNLGLAKSGSSVYPNRNAFAQQVGGSRHKQQPAYQSDWI